jgi:hypothetical protein
MLTAWASHCKALPEVCPLGVLEAFPQAEDSPRFQAGNAECQQRLSFDEADGQKWP